MKTENNKRLRLKYNMRKYLRQMFSIRIHTVCDTWRSLLSVLISTYEDDKRY